MLLHRAALACSLLLLALACCGDDSSSALDAGAQVADGGVADAGASDAAGALTEEVEPNNGDTATEVNMVSPPVAMSGAIGAANDIDIFAVNLTAGELLRWTIAADDQNYAPHLAISEASNMRPVTLAYGASGASESFHHFAMKTGLHYLIVRDARNVPAEGSQNIGGAAVRYSLRSSAPTIAATPVTIPSRVSHTLPGVFELGYFSFTLAQSTDLTIEVFAQRKVPASDMDSRLSLFYLTGDEWLITNDNPALDQADSVVTGVLPAGEYRVVVDNVDPLAADLAFELDFSVQ
jgi:hypothetical protein